MNYKNLTLFLFFLTFLLFYSCSNDNVTSVNNNTLLDTTTFKYPFTIGSSWNFHRLSTVGNIRPDSIRHFFSNYPINGTGIIQILNDTVINGKSTRCFRETYSDLTQNGVNSKYYSNDSSSLICYAYRSNVESSEMPDNYLRGVTFKKGDLFFKNPADIENNILNNYNPDSLFINNPPDTCLKYPIVKGLGWEYRNTGSLRIQKKYLSFESLNVNGSFISVIKTQRIYNNADFNYFDYYSRFGEMKREFWINNIIVTNEFGQEVGTVDINDTYTVNSYNINP